MNKFRKEQVNKKLKPLGWEIPKGIPYEGMLDNHPVRCTKCGWVQYKRLDNLIYRQEECPQCGQGVFDDTMLDAVQRLQEAVNGLKAEFLVAISNLSNVEPVEVKQATSDLKGLFRRYIAKKGMKLKGRKLMSDEWHKLSHELAEHVMWEIADDQAEFDKWESFYTDLLADHPTKQGQDILLAVIPTSKHDALRDEIAKRMVKL